MSHLGRTLEERFWEKVSPEPNSGCWLWIAASTCGYGVIGVIDGYTVDYAHRVAFRLYRGPIPDELELDHLCRTRPCVNPWHLEAVTAASRELSAVSIGWAQSQESRVAFVIEWVRFTVPGLRLKAGLNSVRGTSRGAAMANAARIAKERELTRVFLLEALEPVVPKGKIRAWERAARPMVIEITRVSKETELDDDNLSGACKAVRDSIAKVICIDDGSPDLYWGYVQKRGRPLCRGLDPDPFEDRTARGVDVIRFPVIVADPPWEFTDRLSMSKVKRGSASFYPVLDVGELERLEIPIIRDQVLALWCPSALIQDGLDVMNAWGFRFKQVVTWVKTSKDGKGLAFGMGHHFRNCTEHALIGVRGKVTPRRRNVRNVIQWPALPHSSKPEILQDLLEEMYLGGEREGLELFARRVRPGWHCLGNEIDGRDIRDVLRDLE